MDLLLCVEYDVLGQQILELLHLVDIVGSDVSQRVQVLLADQLDLLDELVLGLLCVSSHKGDDKAGSFLSDIERIVGGFQGLESDDGYLLDVVEETLVVDVDHCGRIVFRVIWESSDIGESSPYALTDRFPIISGVNEPNFILASAAVVFAMTSL